MIEHAWDEYRGWAKRARSLQEKAGRWNVWAMVALVATGAFGAAGTIVGAYPLVAQELNDQIARALACAAAVASALSLYVGRQALAVGAETGWLRARATAEAIKSECFRFAAGIGDYASDNVSDADAANAFIERRKALAARAAGDSLTPDDDPVGAGSDDRRPSRPMSDQGISRNASTGRSSSIGRARRSTSAPMSSFRRKASPPGRPSPPFPRSRPHTARVSPR